MRSKGTREIHHFLLLVLILEGAFCQPQTASPARQLLLENETVRIFRVVIPPGSGSKLNELTDTVVVDIKDEKATFIPMKVSTTIENKGDSDSIELLIQPKKHWDAEVKPCQAPMQCTRETRMAGGLAIAWTTTLFTNGFITATLHRLDRGGTLNSSYYRRGAAIN